MNNFNGLLFLMIGINSCYPVKKTASGGGAAVIGNNLFADDTRVVDEIAEFYFSTFQVPYLTNWDEIQPHSRGGVSASRIPYTDYWYPERIDAFIPEKRGVFGTNIDGALKLYDDAFYGGRSTAVAWENEFHSGGDNSREWSWFGHCNGASTAASRHQNPGTALVKRPKGCGSPGAPRCIIFEPKHIRALLAEIYMNAKARFIAGDRCRTEEADLDSNPQNRIPPDVMGECEDVNPGSFHLALINWIGVQKEVVVFDYNRDREVWNYPLYKYSIDVRNNGNPLTAQQALRLIGRTGTSSYVFNPRAQQFYHIVTTVTYSRAYNQTLEGAAAPTNAKEQVYQYVLEIDKDGEVIGGEWVGESGRRHPDFVWMPFEPRPPPGTRKFGNKYVDPEVVLELWRDSKPFGPSGKNPNRILNLPTPRDSWGIVPGYFRIFLDGDATGSVFLGKPIVLQLEIDGRFSPKGQVRLLLNGAPLTSFETDKRKFRFDFEPQQGMNSLSFDWNLPGVDSALVNVSMRFIALH